MNKVSLEYIAGLFDGEGYIGVGLSGKKYHNFTISLTNHHVYALQQVQKVVGGKFGKLSSYGLRQGNEVPFLEWWSVEGMVFLKRIQPYTIVKRPQIDLVLTYPLNLSKRCITQEMFDRREVIRKHLMHMKQEYKTEVAPDWEPSARQIETDPTVKEAIRLYQSAPGMTQGKVAELMGIEPSTVGYWIRQLKVVKDRRKLSIEVAKTKKHTVTNRPEVYEAGRLFDQGYTPTEIANKMDVKPATMGYWLRRIGKTRTLAEAQKLRRLREKELKIC